MKIRILGVVFHNGQELKQYEVYNLTDKDAKGLLNEKLAEKVDENKQAEPEPEVHARPKEEVETYAAEAILTPDQRAKLAEEGKLNDTKPVVAPTHEKDPVEAEPIVSGDEAAGGADENADGGRGGSA
jgi:hypothetical protein